MSGAQPSVAPRDLDGADVAPTPSTWRFLAEFSRRTTGGRFLPEIDGLRFVAIGAVVLFHLNTYLLAKTSAHASSAVDRLFIRLFSHGHYGVELFFSISGFILGLPFAGALLAGRKPVDLGAYFRRRLSRLEPPAILNLLLCFVLLVLVRHESPRELAPHLAASLLYSHNVIYQTPSAINGVAWSLEIEIQFYVLVPLIARLYAVRSPLLRRVLFGSLAAAAVTVQLLAQAGYVGPWVSLSIVGYVQYFVVGLLLADVYATNERGHPARFWTWDVIWFVGWAALPCLFEFPRATLVCFAPLLLVLLLAGLRGPLANRLLRNRVVSTIGGMCYSIYLFHYLIISFLGRGLLKLVLPSYALTLLAQFVIMGAGILFGSAVYFRLVERPCMRPNWPAELWARLKSGKVTAGRQT
jgi:peptidoglycan/LPS O-acetylase OafA/YrhL